MTYIRQKLPSNPLDDILAVDENRATDHYESVLDHWLQLHIEARRQTSPASGKSDLSDVVQNIAEEYSRFGLDCEELTDFTEQANADMQVGPNPQGHALTEEELYEHPPPMPRPASQPAPNTRRKSAAVAENKSMPILPATEVPISNLLKALAHRLCILFEHSFASVATSAQVTSATPIITWQPPEVEEDDALALLGLARDPTKISSRTIRAGDERESSVFIACESPPNSLPDDSMDFPACKFLFRCQDVHVRYTDRSLRL